MNTKKPIPLSPQRAKILCPVCGKSTYSRDGIHPQCAVLQADTPRVEQIRADRKREAELEQSGGE